MRNSIRRSSRRGNKQSTVAEFLKETRSLVAGVVIGVSLLSGSAIAALWTDGPAEAWTVGRITIVTNAVVAQLAALQTAFMFESQARFEQVISAVAIATKQESIAANQVVDASVNAGQTLVNAVRAQRISDATVKAYVDYSPVTGQGYDACGTVAKNRSLDKAFDDAPGSARKKMQQLDNAPGNMVDSRVVAMANRLNLHRNKFCTASEASAGLCKLGSVPGGDSNASLLFTSVDEASDQALARRAFIQNVTGAPDEKMTTSAGKSPAGQAYLYEKNRKDALLSIPAYSLSMIDANNTRTAEFGNRSPNEMMKLRVNQYFGGKEAQRWSSSMAAQATRGLIVEATKMAGLEVWMRHKQYEQGQRLEANLAALVLTSTDELQIDVDQKHKTVLSQTAAKAVQD